MRLLFSFCVLAMLLGCPSGGDPTPDGGSGDGGRTGGFDGGLLPNNYDAVGWVVFEQNGKIVAAGGGGKLDEGEPSRRPDFFVARASTDLVLDTTFGEGKGFALTDLDGGTGTIIVFNEDQVFGAIPDGEKVVAVGYARGPTATPSGVAAVVRYNADGTLDTTFNGRGYGLLDFNPTSPTANPAAAYSIAKRADGKYMVGGTVENGSVRGQDMFVARFNTDGTLDNTFSTGLPIDFSNGREAAYDLVLQGTKTVTGGGQGFPIIRFTDTGTEDSTFGTAGRVSSPGGTMAMLLQRPDGKLLGIGTQAVDLGTSTERAVLKLFQVSADGVPDTAFGPMGVKTIDGTMGSGPAGDLRGGAFTADGSLILYTDNITGSRLFKIKPDGTVDTTWGTQGVKPTGLRISLLGLITGLPKGAHALTVVGTNAYVTGTDLTPIDPGRSETLFSIMKVGL